MGLVRLGGVEYGFGALVELRECHCLVLVGLDVVYCWENGVFFRSESWDGMLGMLSAVFYIEVSG